MICDLIPLRTAITISLVVAMTGQSWGAENVYDKIFSQLLIMKNNPNFLISVSKETVDVLGEALNFFMIHNGDRISDGRSYVYLWLILGVVRQKPTQHCKAITLQPKIDFLKNKI